MAFFLMLQKFMLEMASLILTLPSEMNQASSKYPMCYGTVPVCHGQNPFQVCMPLALLQFRFASI